MPSYKKGEKAMRGQGIKRLFFGGMVAIAGVVLGSCYAANTPAQALEDPASFAVEAEALSWTPAGATTVVASSSASAGNAVAATGAATGTVTGWTGALRQISITARGDQCQGAPIMQVKLDGALIGTTNVTSTSWTTYQYPVNVPAGTHELSVSYVNPYNQWFFSWNICNRALHVDKADIYGASSTTGEVPVSAKYVSLGDSYSSGMGSEKTPTTPVNTGVYDPSAGNCYRSTISAARLLAAARSYALTDVSCAGATTANVLSSGQYGQAAQITGVTSDTKLVTLTIGGNDVGLLSFISCAIESECTTASPTTQAIQAATAQLQPKITAVLTAIKTAAPGAQIRIAGYPYLLGLPDTTTTGNCTVASLSELQLFANLTVQVNNVIKQAAQVSGASVQYVDPLRTDSPFMQRDNDLDRGGCSTNAARLFNGPVDESGYWHPNAGGFDAYYRLYAQSL